MTTQKTVLFDGKKAVTLTGDEGWTYHNGEIITDKKLSADYLYSVVSWLYRCVTVRGNSVASMPFVIKRGDNEVYEFNGTTPENDPPPNIEWIKSLPRLLGMVEIAAILGGRAYAEKRQNRLNTRAVQYDWLLPWSIIPIFNNVPNKYGIEVDKSKPQGDLLGFWREVPPNPQPIRFEPEDLIYFWLPDYAVELGPAVNYPAKAVLQNAGVIRGLDVFLAGYFERGLIDAILLSLTEGQLKESEASRVKEWFTRTFMGGSRTAHKAEVLRGKWEVHQVGGGIKDLRDNVLTQDEKKDIAVGLGIPLSKVDSTASTDSNRDADDVQYIEDTILPEINWIYDVINKQMLGKLGYRIVAKPQSLRVMQTDEVMRAQAFTQYRSGGMSMDATVAVLGITVPEGVKLEEPPKPVPPALQPFATGGQVPEPTEEDEDEDTAVPRRSVTSDTVDIKGDAWKVAVHDGEKWVDITDNLHTMKLEQPQNMATKMDAAGTVQIDHVDTIHLAERIDTIQQFKRWLKKREYKAIVLDDFDPNGLLTNDELLTIAIRETQKANATKVLRQDELADEYGDRLATFIDESLSFGMSQIEMNNALNDFIDQEMEAIFREGAEIPEGEGLTIEETAALREMVSLQREAVGGFVMDLINDSEEEKAISFDRLRETLGGRLAGRLSLWKNQARKVFNKALLVGRGDPDLEWQLGNTEQHCSDCLSNNGRVMSKSEWAAAGIEPQSPVLECGGWNCDCSFVRV